MKLVEYTDEDGWKRRSLIKDNMSDGMAEHGIAQNPPDIRQIDWDEAQKELHNLLVDRGLITVKDIQGNGRLRNAILIIIERKIVDLYKVKSKGGTNE